MKESLTEKTEPDNGVITRRTIVSEGASELFAAVVPETLQIDAVRWVLILSTNKLELNCRKLESWLSFSPPRS